MCNHETDFSHIKNALGGIEHRITVLETRPLLTVWQQWMVLVSVCSVMLMLGTALSDLKHIKESSESMAKAFEKHVTVDLGEHKKVEARVSVLEAEGK